MTAHKETFEQIAARKDIKLAIQNLLDVCRKYDAAFLGYVFGTTPAMLLRFGNVKETGSAFTELLLRLDELSFDKEQEGKILSDPLDEKAN